MKKTTTIYLKKLLRYKVFVWAFLFMFISTPAVFAQNILVKGIVKDSYGSVLPGVFITEKNGNTNATSLADGSYQISVAPNGILVFSFVGMETLEIPVNNRAIVDAILEDDAQMLDEVVAVAYGTQKKANLSGTVSVVDVQKTLEARPVTDVGRALQGSTPGLIVTTTSGEMGGSPTIKIRSQVSTLSGNSGNPLILVDNVEVPDLSYINPDDIESISTLKDAASTSIYGARAAFGAILITTKKGAKGEKVKVTYSNNFAWAKPTNLPEFTRADLALQYSLDQNNNSLTAPVDGFSAYDGYYISREGIQKTKEWIETYGDGSGLGREMVEGRDFNYRANTASGRLEFYRPWDVRSLLYKDWGAQQQHNISVSGGTDNVQYALSAGLVNQGGIFQQFNDYYRRLNTSGNISTKVNKYITLRGGYIYAKTGQEKPMSLYPSGVTDLQQDIYNPTYYLYRWHQVNPYGTFNGKEFRNGVTEMAAAGPITDNTYYSRYNLGITVNIMKGLSAVFDYTYNQTMVTQHRAGRSLSAINIFNAMPVGATFDDMYMEYTGVNPNYAAYDASRNLRNAYNGALIYENSIKNHNFKLQVGTNIEDAEYIYQRSKKHMLADNDKPEPNLATGNISISSSHSWWAVVGLYGRLNYNYKEKYLLEGNLRYDWSSKFPKNDRLGIFPSFSAAWRITEEPWMEPVKSVMNSLKLRGSYGSIGNQDVPNAVYKPTLTLTTPSAGNNYFLVNGAYVSQVTNAANMYDPSLTWEKVVNLDLGFDASFLKNKIGLTMNWYQRKVQDMLTNGAVLPATAGVTSAQRARQNYGELTTKGIEIEVSFNHTFSNGLRINASGQFTDYTTKVTKWAEDENPTMTIGASTGRISDLNLYKGAVVGDIWGYKTEGLWQKDDFVYNSDGSIKTVTLPNGRVTNVLKNYPEGYLHRLETLNFRFSPGDVKYANLNNDNEIYSGTSTVNNHGDLAVIGNVNPRYIYGFRIGAAWKGVDFDVFFQGVGKRHLWVAGNITLPGWMAGEANYTHTLDYWTEENPGAFYPRPMNHSNVARWNYLVNDRYVLNMAYLRCKTISIGYTIPKSITQRAMIERLRVYVSAENLFEFDKLGDNPVDPEMSHTSLTSNDARAYGRAYPYRRTFSFGVQVNF